MQKKLSKLMRISWSIQRQKHSSRSQSLTLAWALFKNEDVFIHYLYFKTRTAAKRVPNSLSIF